MNNTDFQPSEAARNAQEYMAKLRGTSRTNEEIITLFDLAIALAEDLNRQWDEMSLWLAEERERRERLPLAA